MRPTRSLSAISVSVDLTTRVTAVDAFQIIVPIDLSLVFRRWGLFPAVVGVSEQSGPWDGPGRSRRPQLSDGTSAVETLTEYTPPHSFAYEISGFRNVLGRLVHQVRGEWTFTPDGDGTVLRWTYAFFPRPGRRSVVRLVLAPSWRAYATRMLKTTVDHVEAEVARDEV